MGVEQAVAAALAGGQRRRRQRELAVAPRDRRDRQVVFLERLREFDVGPGDEPAVDVEKRLDRKGTLIDLDRAGFAQERLDTVPRAADDGPVELLAKEILRVGAARVVAGDGREEGILARAELGSLDLEPVEREPVATEWRGHGQLQPAALHLGNVQVVASAVACLHGGDPAPACAVSGEQHIVSDRVPRGLPFEHETAEFARVAEVDRQLGGGGRRRGHGPTAEDRALGIGHGGGADADADDRARGAGDGVVDRGEAQVGDVERALAAGGGGDDELDRLDPFRLRWMRGAPGKRDVAFPQILRRPLDREGDGEALVPPDVLLLVDQLHLEVVHARVALRSKVNS